MVIKINYNILTVLCGILLVICICFVDFRIETKQAQAEVEDGARQLPVLMYHHMLENKSRLGDYVISPTQFEDDLKFIKERGFTTISTQQLVDFLQDGKELPEKPIMITFDDGYESVHEYAYPLLKKYQMTAVVSIIGKYTDIYSEENAPKHINYSHLSWKQLEEMQKSGVFDVQNHSFDMHSNSKKSSRYGIRIKRGESEEQYKENLIKDIGGLSKEITEKLNVAPQAFAYPFGALCKQSKPILTELGFKIIFTCEEKMNVVYPKCELPASIRRINRASKYTTQSYFKKFGIE